MNGQPPKSRHGCFFYGCITGLVLMLVATIGIIIAVHYGKKMVTGLVNDYTATKPMVLPTVQMSSADLDKLKKHYADFQTAVKAGRPTPPLVLSADEINALIADSGGQQQLKGKVYLSFDGDRVKGELSVPLKDLGWKIVRDRYLNGNATFNVALQNGILVVSPQTIEVRGKPLPDMYMQALRKANFAQNITNDANAMAVLQKLKDIQVKDGRLVVTPKETAEPAAPKAERE